MLIIFITARNYLFLLPGIKTADNSYPKSSGNTPAPAFPPLSLSIVSTPGISAAQQHFSLRTPCVKVSVTDRKEFQIQKNNLRNIYYFHDRHLIQYRYLHILIAENIYPYILPFIPKICTSYHFCLTWRNSCSAFSSFFFFF